MQDEACRLPSFGPCGQGVGGGGGERGGAGLAAVAVRAAVVRRAAAEAGRVAAEGEEDIVGGCRLRRAGRVSRDHGRQDEASRGDRVEQRSREPVTAHALV